MNSTYLVPAAIALTFHAALFLSSGGPRNIFENGTAVKPPVDEGGDIIILTPDPEPATLPSEGGDCGGVESEAPVGFLDLPRPADVGPIGIEVDRKPVNIGKGTKLPTGPIGFGKGPGKGSGGATLVGIEMLDDTPHTRFQTAPVYPSAMKVAGISGTVWVEFVVDEGGRVHNVRVVKSTHAAFEEPTVAAVSKWRFESGKRHGIPVRFRMSVPVVFSLTE
ncbi:MAG: energy transducer TonB [Nibricoccus sp.]